MCEFQCPRLIDSPVPPVLRGAEPFKPRVILALPWPFSAKDVIEFVVGLGRRRVGSWVIGWPGLLDCDITELSKWGKLGSSLPHLPSEIRDRLWLQEAVTACQTSHLHGQRL